jgi:hypothetical protein
MGDRPGTGAAREGARATALTLDERLADLSPVKTTGTEPTLTELQQWWLEESGLTPDEVFELADALADWPGFRLKNLGQRRGSAPYESVPRRVGRAAPQRSLT